MRSDFAAAIDKLGVAMEMPEFNYA
jgi:hypothetical protein